MPLHSKSVGSSLDRFCRLLRVKATIVVKMTITMMAPTTIPAIAPMLRSFLLLEGRFAGAEVACDFAAAVTVIVCFVLVGVAVRLILPPDVIAGTLPERGGP